MNFKTTLILLVVLIATAGAFLLLRSDAPTEPQSTTTAEPIVTGRDFRRVTLERGGDTYSIRQEPNGWWQTQPLRFPVASESADQLINAGLALTPRQTYSDQPPNDPDSGVLPMPPDDQLGLNPPQAVATFISDTGTHRLLLGRTNTAGTGYLQIDGQPEVYLVDASLHQAVLNADPKSWRPTELPTLAPERVAQLKINRPEQSLDFTRAADGWSLTPDGKQRANDDIALSLAKLATTLQPQTYVSDDPEALSDYGIHVDGESLAATDASGTTHTLWLGRPADLAGQTLYASWSDADQPSPVVFTLDATVLRPVMNLPARNFRDARLSTALPGSIRGQRVQRIGRDTLEIIQGDSQAPFVFVEPQPSYRPDAELVPGWLTTLVDTAPVGFAPAPPEAQAPLAVVDLLLAGDRTETLRLYADRDQREPAVVLVVREDETIAALVPRDRLAPLLAPAITLRERVLPTTPTHDNVRLTRDDGHEFRFTRDPAQPTGWQLEDVPAGEPWEAASFMQLETWLEQPVAEAWTAKSELPRGPIARVSLGQDRPAYVVNVDQGVAQRTDLPGIFRLPPEINALLKDEFRQKLIVPYRADQIQAISMATVPTTEDFTSIDYPVGIYGRDSNGSFTGTVAAIGQASTAKLFDSLAGLTAKRFVAPPPPDQIPPTAKGFAITFHDGKKLMLRRLENGVWFSQQGYFLIDEDVDTVLTETDPSVW